MAQLIQDRPQKKHPPESSSSGLSTFLGCFGFSKTSQKVKEKNNKTKFSSCFYWSRKSLKKSVPLGGYDDASAKKLDQKRKESFRVPKFSRKFSANKLPAAVKTQTLVDGKVEQSQIPAAATDEAGQGRADDASKKGDEGNQKISLENGESMTNHHSDSIANEPPATNKKSAFLRRNSWGQPATSSLSSEHISETSRQPAVLTHSASMPPASAGLPSGGSGGGVGDTGESSPRKNERRCEPGKFDQLVGMSIIVVTLIIMIICGKLCAILCTSAWLYFYPILRSSKNHHQHQQNQYITATNGSKSLNGLDNYEPRKSKKKVVFEGFLERSHRVKGG